MLHTRHMFLVKNAVTLSDRLFLSLVDLSSIAAFTFDAGTLFCCWLGFSRAAHSGTVPIVEFVVGHRSRVQSAPWTVLCPSPYLRATSCHVATTRGILNLVIAQRISARPLLALGLPRTGSFSRQFFV